MATHKFIPITYSCGLEDKLIGDISKPCRIAPPFLGDVVGKCKDCHHLIRHGKFVPFPGTHKEESAYTLDEDTEYLCSQFKNYVITDPTKPCGFRWHGGVVSCLNCPKLATRLKRDPAAAERHEEDDAAYKQRFLIENPEFLEVD
jgi:hypothetical protein